MAATLKSERAIWTDLLWKGNESKILSIIQNIPAIDLRKFIESDDIGIPIIINKPTIATYLLSVDNIFDVNHEFEIEMEYDYKLLEDEHKDTENSQYKVELCHKVQKERSL